MSKTYLLYLLKKHYKTILLMTIVSLFFLPLSAITTKVATRNFHFDCVLTTTPYYDVTNYSFSLHMVVTILLAIFIPTFMHRSFYNRNQLDADLALPIKKWKIATTNFIFGVLVLIAISLFSFSVGFIIFAIKGLPLHFGMLLLYFLVTLVIALFMYVLVYFALSFVHANTDAYMLFGLIMLLPIFIGAVINMNMTSNSPEFINKVSASIFLFNPLPLAFNVQDYFNKAIVIQPAELIRKIRDLATLGCTPNVYSMSQINGQWSTTFTVMLILYPLLGAGLSYLTIRRIVTDKAEYAGTKETSPYLAYYGIIIIAFLAFLSFIDLRESLSIIFVAFITTSYFVAMFVNARKITLSKKILIPFGIITVLALIIKIILHFTL